ncbi:MAG: lipid-A-disaccharide synthase [Flavobacteriaceae bacterium]
MKYYIIAGEASGDLHGSNLIKALMAKDEQADIRCWGGDLMEKAGGTLVKHYRETAFMGFLEVLLNIGSIFENIRLCKKDISSYKPDVIVFIDYSGFNLRIAKWAKKEGFRTIYYISPQIWASREKRIRKIKRDIDKMFVILPFEKEFYENKHNYNVDFVGHPLIDAISSLPLQSEKEFRLKNQLDPLKPIIALLPGSRKQEIKNMLAVMLKMVEDFKEYQFVVAGAPSLGPEEYAQYLQGKKVSLVHNQTYDLLQNAHAALVTSGTATLETALFKIPQVVCYKGNWISYQIARRIITLDYISLVNLIMDKEVVRELIQSEFNAQNLKNELANILEGSKREIQLDAYEELEKRLGGRGASEKTASLIVENV